MKDICKEIYWDVEELKSYTDLSGERFDIDSAQRRLWKMNPILKTNPEHPAKEIYNTLDEMLEYPPGFDKRAFSEQVDLLYELVEKER